MMCKVLIVDDETLILEGIAEGIDWDRLECCKPFLADNGLEALAFIEKNDIDIVITDIKMPGMNGLELAEWIHTNRKGIYVIVLSGYDDFKYAQNALRFGVTEYILKPTKLKELEISIEKVKKKIREQNKINTVYNESREIIEHSNRQFIIESFIFNRISNAERMKHILESMAQDIYLHRIILLQVCNYSKDFIEKSDYIIEYIKYVEEIIKNFKDNRGIDVLVQYEKDEILIYLSSDSRLMSLQSFLQATDRTVLLLKIKINDFVPFDMVIGYSHTDNNISNLKNMYLEAVDKCDIEKQSFLMVQDFQTENKGLKGLLNPDFQIHLCNKDLQMVMSDVDEIFQKSLGKTGTYIKGIAIELINYAVLCCAGKLSMDCIDMHEVYESIVISCERNGISYIVKDFMKKLCLCADTAVVGEYNCSEFVDRIAKYIRKNFFRDLSLESVAEQFYISPGHLSRLLREKWNTTFLDLLTRVRIENAKIMLQNSKFKIYEIGTMIGFKDSKYFSQVFKKLTGKTPSEFK